MGYRINIESIKEVWEYMLHSFPEFAKFSVPFDRIQVYRVSNKTMKKFEGSVDIDGLVLGRTYRIMDRVSKEVTYLILFNKANNEGKLFDTIFHELLHVVEYETNNTKLTDLFEKLAGNSDISEAHVDINIAEKLLRRDE